MKPNKFDAVLALAGGEVSCSGDEYIFHDGQAPPTEEPIQAKIEELQAEYDAQEYARNRSSEYPTWQEQMDMQYWDAKNGTTTWQETIEAVKTKFPKGE